MALAFTWLKTVVKVSHQLCFHYGRGLSGIVSAFQYCCTQEGIFAAFLCRVVLGKPYTCTHSQRSVVQPEGYNSVLAASSNQVCNTPCPPLCDSALTRFTGSL